MSLRWRTDVNEDAWKIANVTEAEQPLYLPDEDNKPFMQQDGDFKATPHGKFSLWYNQDTQGLRSFCLEPYKQSTLVECGPVDGDSCLSWLRNDFSPVAGLGLALIASRSSIGSKVRQQ